MFSDMDIFAGNVVVGGVGISEEKPGGTRATSLKLSIMIYLLAPAPRRVYPLCHLQHRLYIPQNASIWQSKYSASGDRGTITGLGVGLAEQSTVVVVEMQTHRPLR